MVLLLDGDMPDLLLNTAPITVIAMVLPKGIAKAIREITEAIFLGKKATPCKLLGINRSPVPAPVKPIIP